MNHLAHLVLADDTPESLIGNLAGDFLQGADRASLHPALQAGIARHRAVDAFTDAHPLVAGSRARLGAGWRHMGRVLVDVFYDHFLAADFSRHTGRELRVFSARVYAALDSHRHLMPPRLARAAPVMIRHDWLAAYAHIEGVGVILQRMAQRARHGRNLALALGDLRSGYTGFARDFDEFFPLLKRHISSSG